MSGDLTLGNAMSMTHGTGDFPWYTPWPNYVPVVPTVVPTYVAYPVYIQPSTKELEDKIAALTEQVERLTKALKARKR